MIPNIVIPKIVIPNTVIPKIVICPKYAEKKRVPPVKQKISQTASIGSAFMICPKNVRKSKLAFGEADAPPHEVGHITAAAPKNRTRKNIIYVAIRPKDVWKLLP